MSRFSIPPLSRKTREMRRVFGVIHATRAWGPGESVSGPGSTRERAAAFLDDLMALVRSLGVSTLLDAFCGDFNWAGPLADSVERYIGVDVVPEIIRDDRRRWAAANREFLCRDVVRQRLPRADLVFCRDALVHLRLADILAALANLRRTRAEYLLTTTFTGDRVNTEIANGEWRPLNLERPPFSFPPPLARVDERRRLPDGEYADKYLGLWRFSDLPLASIR